jgi:hypothetical protein
VIGRVPLEMDPKCMILATTLRCTRRISLVSPASRVQRWDADNASDEVLRSEHLSILPRMGSYHTARRQGRPYQREGDRILQFRHRRVLEARYDSIHHPVPVSTPFTAGVEIDMAAGTCQRLCITDTEDGWTRKKVPRISCDTLDSVSRGSATGSSTG